jgi:hypothetical protein
MDVGVLLGDGENFFVLINGSVKLQATSPTDLGQQLTSTSGLNLFGNGSCFKNATRPHWVKLHNRFAEMRGLNEEEMIKFRNGLKTGPNH